MTTVSREELQLHSKMLPVKIATDKKTDIRSSEITNPETLIYTLF